MPTFDIVSEVEMHEVNNAVDQANREVGTRFDFKGSNAVYERNDSIITMKAQSEFQLTQMLDILQTKLHRRGVDITCIEEAKPEMLGKVAKQNLTLRQGIEPELARKIVKIIKGSKIKVQAAIQGDKLRITGKKRDDLQATIALIKESKLGLPIQFDNFRD
ncbi:MAG: YajQ family cyclic di-GMP-binding protein [Gammaproteobacteria bacterium]|nr:YajQ family cyclic di-GMP-binding protein [Gammaproteobacteria bacterium]